LIGLEKELCMSRTIQDKQFLGAAAPAAPMQLDVLALA
jgi:hypothetical protein